MGPLMHNVIFFLFNAERSQMKSNVHWQQKTFWREWNSRNQWIIGWCVTMMEIWFNQIIFQDVDTHLNLSDCWNMTTKWKLAWLIHLCTALVPLPRCSIHCLVLQASCMPCVFFFICKGQISIPAWIIHDKITYRTQEIALMH